MESKVVRHGEREDGGRRRTASGKGDRDKKIGLEGLGRVSEEAGGVGMCSPIKHICLFYEESPSHGPIPPIVRMARWPKTAGEIGKCIGADSVRTIKQGRVLCL